MIKPVTQDINILVSKRIEAFYAPQRFGHRKEKPLLLQGVRNFIQQDLS